MDVACLFELLDSSEDFFLVSIDNKGNYTYVNKAFAKRFRHIAENFIGKSCIPTIHKDDHPLLFEVVKQCISKRGEFIPITLHKPTAENQYTTTRWNFMCVENKDNLPVSIICLGFEITEFINKIDTHKEIIADLLNIHSHEVRKPLANILGLISLLDVNKMSETDQSYINYIRDCIHEFDDVLKRLAGRF